MRKILKFVLSSLVVIPIALVIFFVIGFSGGVKGVWYDITKPTLDPYNLKVTKNREFIKSKIVTDFDHIDSFSSITSYGIYNTDLCLKRDYSYKRPISVFDHLYTCKYISQRYYGVDGDYENSVRALIEYIEKDNEGLSFQPYQIEQLFVQKDWMRDEPTINKIISSYNIRHEDNPASNIYDAISFIEGQNQSTVNTYSSSEDGYIVQLDFFDSGSSPSNIESSELYEEGDALDLRDEYISEINEKHPYGVVVTVTYVYYQL